MTWTSANPRSQREGSGTFFSTTEPSIVDTVRSSGPTETVLTPGRIRDLYDVDVEIARHQPTGHLTVIPVKVVERGPQP